jgi:hypothetical protein
MPLLKHLYSGVFHLPLSSKAAAVIGDWLGIRPTLREAIHLPRFAEKTARPTIL